ncbi:hypothetical protein [Desulfospira joergensenii]|uniref:hypothetical protein n=1 Tax=Desulfospira joergensenii TaxID=53329 RepID=UPI0003B34A5C|nr:hypothetical protein [Desulfospira joergensenii]
MESTKYFSGISLFIFLVFFPALLAASESYIGIWKRDSHYLNERLMGREPASLVITTDAFNKVVKAPPEQACGMSASLSVQGDKLHTRVVVSSCPSTIPAGKEITYTYQVSAGKMTLTHASSRGRVKEIFSKEVQAGTPGSTQAEPCAHPYCGTWLRTATYVGGKLTHTEPSTAVITDKTYWAVAAACYNLLDIMSVEETRVLLKMVRHNCPTPAGFMPPGHLVPGTWKLTENGEKLSIIDTNYGVAVTTDFKRLK